MPIGWQHSYFWQDQGPVPTTRIVSMRFQAISRSGAFLEKVRSHLASSIGRNATFLEKARSQQAASVLRSALIVKSTV